jgi:hypothetical protein
VAMPIAYKIPNDDLAYKEFTKCMYLALVFCLRVFVCAQPTYPVY